MRLPLSLGNTRSEGSTAASTEPLAGRDLSAARRAGWWERRSTVLAELAARRIIRVAVRALHLPHLWILAMAGRRLFAAVRSDQSGPADETAQLASHEALDRVRCHASGRPVAASASQPHAPRARDFRVENVPGRLALRPTRSRLGLGWHSGQNVNALTSADRIGARLGLRCPPRAGSSSPLVLCQNPCRFPAWAVLLASC